MVFKHSDKPQAVEPHATPVSVVFAAHHLVQMASFANIVVKPFHCNVILMHALNEYAMQRDWISKDYSQFVQTPKVDTKHQKGAFTRLEPKRLEDLAASGFPGADSALALCLTGLRTSEFLTLTRFSYDPGNHALRGGSKTEARKDCIVPVHPKFQPYNN